MDCVAFPPLDQIDQILSIAARPTEPGRLLARSRKFSFLPQFSQPFAVHFCGGLMNVLGLFVPSKLLCSAIWQMQFVTSDKYAICNALDGSLRRKMEVRRWEGMLGAGVCEFCRNSWHCCDRQTRAGESDDKLFWQNDKSGRWLVGEQPGPDGVVAIRCKSPYPPSFSPTPTHPFSRSSIPGLILLFNSV